MKALIILLLAFVLPVRMMAETYKISNEELTKLETALTETRVELQELKANLSEAKSLLILARNELKLSKENYQTLKTLFGTYENEALLKIQKEKKNKEIYRGVCFVGIPLAVLVTTLIVGLSK